MNKDNKTTNITILGDEYKTYNHKAVEEGLYRWWKENGFFDIKKPTECKNGNFCITLPPPNITGKLHIGHALDTTLQDVIIRYKLLQGYRVYFAPGTDHASIATQSKVEKLLREQGVEPSSLPREELYNRIKVWALQQASFIREQWADLGLSLSYCPLDQSKYEIFTLDPEVHEVIYKEFVELYNEGLLYRAKKIVNWDIKLQTAVSDLEVIKKPTTSKLWYIKYYLEGSKDTYLVIATTRPETIFVDTNLVVNPKDEKYTQYVGKNFVNPLNGQLLPLITDDAIEMDFGTGIMKCTPAHDNMDYEIAQRHNIKEYNTCINFEGKLNEFAKVDGLDLQGVDRIVAREKIIDFLKAKNLLEKTDENYTNNVGYSERTGEVIEPLPSLQWFVKMKPVIQKTEQLFKDLGKPNFITKNGEKTFDKWISDIQDWCISRQLVWGHRIPVWYHKTTDEIYVSVKPPKDIENWKQDEDVLDTWFSSGIWPLACTKYHKSGQLADFYPVDLLVTGWDIIFFWVARMIFQCAYIDNTISLKNIFLHGIVRDELGRKMSKSLGNGIDPTDVINTHGADALRTYLASNASGEDINFTESKIEHIEHFINKIWNIEKLVNKSEDVIKLPSEKELSLINKWIITEYYKTVKEYSEKLDNYNYNGAFKVIINFVWDTFANEYLEIARKNEQWKNQTDKVINFIFKNILIMLHPYMPFVTERLYQKAYQNSKASIMEESWPAAIQTSYDENSSLICLEIFKAMKNTRIKFNLKNSKVIAINLSTDLQISFSEIKDYLKDFNIDLVEMVKTHDNEKTILTINGGTIIFLDNLISEEEENRRYQEQISKLESEINRSETILKNADFLARAPKEKIELEQKKYLEFKKQYNELVEVLQKNLNQNKK